MLDIQPKKFNIHVRGVGYEFKDGRGASTHGRILATVKSLLSFAHKTGYTPFNAGQAVQIPQPSDALSE